MNGSTAWFCQGWWGWPPLWGTEWGGSWPTSCLGLLTYFQACCFYRTDHLIPRPNLLSVAENNSNELMDQRTHWINLLIDLQRVWHCDRILNNEVQFTSIISITITIGYDIEVCFVPQQGHCSNCLQIKIFPTKEGLIMVEFHSTWSEPIHQVEWSLLVLWWFNGLQSWIKWTTVLNFYVLLFFLYFFLSTKQHL